MQRLAILFLFFSCQMLLAQSPGQLILQTRATSGNGYNGHYFTPGNSMVLGTDGSGNLILSNTLPAANGSLLTGIIAGQIGGLTNSQWTTSGSTIYYNTGNVGIGNASPSTPLNVFSNSFSGGTIGLFETNIDTDTAFQINTLYSNWQFSVRSSTDGYNPMGFSFYNNTGGGWNSIFSLAANGAVYTANNTLDDGSANARFSGIVYLDNDLVAGSGNICQSSHYDYRFNGEGDANWRAGINLGSYTTTTIGAATSIGFVIGTGSEGPDGFSVGQTGGSSIFELRGYDSSAWFAGSVQISGSITASSPFSIITPGSYAQDSVQGQINLLGQYWSGSGSISGSTITSYKATPDGSAGTYLTISTIDTGNVLNERLRIDDAGNVGINTTDPAHVLEVRGDIYGASAELQAQTLAGNALQIHSPSNYGTIEAFIDYLGNLTIPTITSIAGAQIVNSSGNISFAAGQTLADGNNIYYSSGNLLADNSNNLYANNFYTQNDAFMSEGSFDNGHGGNLGISLNCTVGYELNWQAGYLSASYSAGTVKVPIILDSSLQFHGTIILDGGGTSSINPSDRVLIGSNGANTFSWDANQTTNVNGSIYWLDGGNGGRLVGDGSGLTGITASATLPILTFSDPAPIVVNSLDDVIFYTDTNTNPQLADTLGSLIGFDGAGNIVLTPYDGGDVNIVNGSAALNLNASNININGPFPYLYVQDVSTNSFAIYADEYGAHFYASLYGESALTIAANGTTNPFDYALGFFNDNSVFSENGTIINSSGILSYNDGQPLANNSELYYDNGSPMNDNVGNLYTAGSIYFTNSGFQVGLTAPGGLAASQTWTLPPADGSSTQVLTTNGTGALYFSSVGATDGFPFTTPSDPYSLIYNSLTNVVLATDSNSNPYLQDTSASIIGFDGSGGIILSPSDGNVAVEGEVNASGTYNTFSGLRISGSDTVNSIYQGTGNLGITGNNTITLTPQYGSTIGLLTIYGEIQTSSGAQIVNALGQLCNAVGDIIVDGNNFYYANGDQLADNSGNLYTSGALYANSSGAGVYINGTGGSDYGQLRVVGNGGAWADASQTAYFQASTLSNNYLTFQGGIGGSDAQLGRLQFCSQYTTITDFGYGQTPVPNSLLELQMSQDKRTLMLMGVSGQESDFIDIYNNPGSNGLLLSVDANGDVYSNGYIQLNGNLQMGNTGSYIGWGDAQLNYGGTGIVSTTNGVGEYSAFQGAAMLFYDNTTGYIVSLSAPTGLTGSTGWVLPFADGSGGQVMTTDGAGNLSFTSVSFDGALTSSQTLSWNSDSGISRIGAGVLGIGDGTLGDTSGTLELMQLNINGNVSLYSGLTGQYQFDSFAGGGNVILDLRGTVTNSLQTRTGALYLVDESNAPAALSASAIRTGTAWNGNIIGSTYGGAGSVSGILKANGSGVVSAAAAGTDYLAPGGSGGGLSGVVTTVNGSSGAISNIQTTNGALALAGFSSITGAIGSGNLPAVITGNTSINGTSIPSSQTLLYSGGAIGTPISGTLTNCTIPWSQITSTPATLSGYGITNAVVNTTTVNGHALSSNVVVSASDLTTGTLPAGAFPALTGDITTSAGALATTLATVNSNTGTFGSATQSSTITVNGKGLITAASAQTITPAIGSITGLGSGVSTWLASGTLLAFNTLTGQTILYSGGALGTPSSATLTNATGLPISGIASLGTGVGTWLGSGTLTAFDTLVGQTLLYSGGALGTPSSGTLTNATGLPVSTGISGLGTGVATWLGSGTLSALNTLTGDTILYSGSALGTPASGTLTNCGSLPISGIASLGTGVGTWLATPTLANLNTALGVILLKASNNLSDVSSTSTALTNLGGEFISNKSTDATLGGGSPSNTLYPTQAAVQSYVNAVAQGLSPKASVAVATTAALPVVVYNNGSSGVGATLTEVSPTTLTIDGYAVQLGDRILVQNQVAATQNGIYSCTTLGTGLAVFVLTRTTDADTPADIEGAFVFVENGTVNANAGFVNTNTGTITIGPSGSNITFTQFSGAGEIVAGTGLTKTGNTLSVNASQVISTISNLTSNGHLQTTGGTGALSVDTAIYLTGNQTVTLTGDTTGSGATSIATTTVALNGTNLAGLGNGFLYNTTGTGIPSTIGSTGSGNVVRATSATLVTPALGTPSSGTLTSCSGLPISGIASLGTGVGTWLGSGTLTALNTLVGQTLLYSGGALGTPSSGTLTNCTFPSSLQTTAGVLALAGFSSITGNLPVANLGSGGGTASSITYLRGDNTWATPAGSSYTFSTGLTNTAGTVTVNSSQSIATLSNLTSNGIVTTSGSAGTLSVTATTGSGNVVLATSPTLVTPALGTPASGVATNLTGTASGLTAGTVTTNANLTGDVTSSGNATTIATVNSNVGSYTSANITVNAKGQVTAAANGSGGSGTILRSHLAGYVLSNDTVTPASVLDIGPGQATDSTNAVYISQASLITKSIASTFTSGSGNGGLDIGTVGTGTYHVYAINGTSGTDVLFSLANANYNPSNGNATWTVTMTSASPCVVTWANHGLQVGSPIVFSTTGALYTGITAGTTYYVISAGFTTGSFEISTTQGGSAVNTSGSQSGIQSAVSNPTLPSGYTYFRRIGSILYKSSSIYGFRQDGDRFQWTTPVRDVGGTSILSTPVVMTLTLPVGVPVEADLGVTFQSGNSMIYNPLLTLPTLLSTTFFNTGGTTIALQRVTTNNSGQVAAVSYSGSGTSGYISTNGYWDTRGKNN